MAELGELLGAKLAAFNAEGAQVSDPSGAGQISTAREVVRVLNEVDKGALEVPEQIDLATSLDDVGLSFLDRVELAVRMEDAFKAEVDETVASEWNTINDLVTWADSQR